MWVRSKKQEFQQNVIGGGGGGGLVTESCPTLATPMDCSPPGSSVHGILQARILEWVAISFSRGSFQPRDQICLYVSCIGWQILYHLHYLGKKYSTAVEKHLFCYTGSSVNMLSCISTLAFICWCWSWNIKYFGHLMWRIYSLEKTLMLGKIEGRRRRWQQRMRWLMSWPT